jgi:hypothetical protein
MAVIVSRTHAWLQARTINYEDALITLQLVLAKMQVSSV